MNALNIFPTCRMNPATGYGLLELGLVKALHDRGVPVHLLDAFDKRTKHDVTIITASPEWAEDVPGRKWALTMSESTKVSDLWVDLFNTHYERIFVPAPFLVEVYKDCGVQPPVEFVPLGMDYEIPEWCNRVPPGTYLANTGIEQGFNWLTYSLGDTRKGAELAMLAFNRCFDGDPRHHLYIKCRDNPQWLSGLDEPQITIVRGETSQAEWYDLLYKCHAMIFPSRGEGFGYPPRQAVLTGMPVIATEAHGMWDVAEWGYPLPVKELRPAQFNFQDANGEGGLWWEPDRDTIDGHMKRIVEDYPAALDKARKGRDYLLKHFTWDKTVDAIVRWL